jgi:predicted Zn-dependent peptidase
MAGNIEIAKAEEMVRKYFSDMPAKKLVNREVKVTLKSKTIVKKKDIEQVHIGIAYPTLKRYEKLLDATQIMNYAFGASMSSRLFQTVREKLGLAYTVYSYLSTYEYTGALVVYAGVNPNNYEASLDAINGCIKQLKTKDMTESEFNRGKEQLLSSNIFAQESTSSQMLLYGKELLYSGKIYDFEERVKKIHSITLNDVYEAIEYNFDPKYKAMAVVRK